MEWGWIRPSVSPFGAPILFICKKTGKVWKCLDYHSLHLQTLLDLFPILCIANLFDHLDKASVFRSIKLSHAYNYLPIHEGDEQKTIFLILHRLFEYLVIIIELYNTLTTF